MSHERHASLPAPVSVGRPLLLVAVAAAVPLAVALADEVRHDPLLGTVGLSALAGSVALAAHRVRTAARLLDTEHDRAIRDPLTDLPNRRGFEEAVAREAARVARSGAATGLFLLDFDRFHWINERYGYAGGDLIVREVAHRLRRELRAADLVARWGGEELVVLAPDLDTRSLAALAEKLRLLVRDTPVVVGDEPATVTCSVGGAVLDGRSSVELCFERANRALRRAKERRDASAVDGLAPEAAAGLELRVDPLTGLLDRQSLTDGVLPREVERTLASGQPLALAVVDLDGFSEVNDIFGSATGDAVIAASAAALATVVGRDDLVFRVEGDGFAALLPLDGGSATEIAHRIVAAIARRSFAPENELGASVARVTATAGLGVLVAPEAAGGHEPAAVAQSLLTTARHALERGKQSGGGCVVATTLELPAAGAAEPDDCAESVV
jgi:diguanylate cyclase (GGDEF)-like protein